jgi:alanyl-tRNA synthetase
MRLYWEDAYRTDFSAQIVRSWNEQGKYYTVLDQTLFYPGVGGQAPDQGSLNGLQVLEVYEESKAKGELVHVTNQPLTAEVQGQIDWTRRYRHMQRHTAEHMLAQAFWRAGQWETLAVNMLGSVCTIDFSGEPEETIVKQAEALANWAVYANTPVHTYTISSEDVEGHQLRRTPKVTGEIRVVDIENWDKVACGGTHVRYTGEAGPIKILKHERYKGGTRVYFSAGWEALETFTSEHALLSKLAEKFSTGVLEIAKPISNMQDEYYKLRGENMALRDELAERTMRELLAQFPDHTIWAQVSENVLDSLGKRLAEWPGVLALLVAPSETKTRYVLLKHSSRPEDLQDLWETVLKPLGAKGGGALVKLGVLPVGAGHKALEAFRSMQKPR